MRTVSAAATGRLAMDASESVQRARARRAAIAGLMLVLAVAAAGFRIYDLGFRSLWLDEIFTAQVVRLPDVGSVVGYVEQDPGSTPLHYLVTWLLRPLGVDEFAIRLPYAIAGAGAVLALAALVTTLYGRVPGFAAGALMAILPFAIYYSQESRPYAFLMLLSALAMLAAYRAVVGRRDRDWGLLAIACALDLYIGYLAIAVILAAYAYVALVFAVDGLHAWRAKGLQEAARAMRRRVALAAGSVALIGVAFLPWWDNFLRFLQHRELAFGRATAGFQPTLGEASTLLAQLDFHGWLFGLLAVGVVWAVIDALRGRWREAVILPIWLFVPLVGFAFGTGGGIVTIWPRYFGAIYPAGVALAAVGADGLARGIAALIRVAEHSLAREMPVGTGAHPQVPLLPSAGRIIVTIGLCCIVAVDALPADAAAYTRPKGSDYRGAADAILRADSGQPLVLVVGPNPDWTVSGLGYYSWVRGSRLAVLDPLKLNADDLSLLRSATSVWGAGLIPGGSPDPTHAGLTAAEYSDITVVRLRIPGPSAVTQARSILAWASTFEPEATTTMRLIDLLEGHASTGPQLLPPPTASQQEAATEPMGRWIMQPGSSLGSDATSFNLNPAGGSTNVYLTTATLVAGRAYVLSFTCAGSTLEGSANVFVVASGSAGQAIFPDGAGYHCRSGSASDDGIFAFTLPPGTTSATLWLRATGTGEAIYRSLSLRELT